MLHIVCIGYIDVYCINILNIHFVIQLNAANQQTIVELISYFHRIMPSHEVGSNKPASRSTTDSLTSDSDLRQARDSERTPAEVCRLRKHQL